MNVPYITKDKTLIRTLTKASAEYKKRFKKERPWWWVCSDEEKLERIKLAFEIDTPYPEYAGSRYDTSYRLGKAIAAYEMWFKRQPPKQDYPDEEWLARLENAIKAESPFLTVGEEALLKAEYLKMFERPITDFEASIVKVSLARRNTDGDNPQTSIIRTTIGAIALYQPYAARNSIVSINPGSTELELSLGEWLNFTNAFHKYIGSHREADCTPLTGIGRTRLAAYWELRLFFANTDTEMPRINC